MVATRIKVAAAAGVAFGAAIVGGFGPLVRHELAARASRYGAEVTVESIAPTWGALHLHGVDVTLAEVPAAHVHLDEVVVTVGGAGTVALRGGLIELTGRREEVLKQVLAWRAHRAAGASTGGSGSAAAARPIEVAGLDVRWQDEARQPKQAAEAKDIRLTRADGVVRLDAASASGRSSFGKLELVRPSVTFAHSGDRVVVRELTADGVESAVELPAPKPAEPDADSEPEKVSGAKAGGAPAEPQRAERLRATARALATALDGALDSQARVRLLGVHARLQRGDDVLNLGPGSLGVQRKDGRLELELSPDSKKPAGKPDEQASEAQLVTFKLTLPLGAEGGEVVADVHGGPIGLSALGVHEGDFGLFDVGQASLATRAHVVLAADGQRLTFDADGKLHRVSVRSAALSDEPVAGLELAFRAKGELDLDGRLLELDDGELDLGAIRVSGRGRYDRDGAAHRLEASWDVPLTACQSMLDSAPHGLVPKLKGMRMAGSFSLRGRVAFDTARLDKTFKLDWDIANSCRVTDAPPDISVERFRHPFTHTIYTPEGKPQQVETGPGTPEWVSLSHISKFMTVAVMTTEDGGFERHHGFDKEAIKNSIRENLRAMKFARGASTISMQLAKNIYLDRTKNLSRKLQEAVLTMYLEQELTKEQILELYLNVIEFGPMVYGIGPAARHYFNGPASDLSLGQALYVSSIMPNPKVQHFGAGGAASTSWMRYLHKLMRSANERHRITDEELDEGLRETVIRGSPAPQRAAPGASPDGPVLDEPAGAVEGGEWVPP